ncbi:sigma-54-dependent transcriptional regulator [Brumimicrobium oceani]|uniref:Regulator n=1 Tax=Brumimicrobium oceani TaxID=2100725 RepID=A0A2U2XGI0_9FLAO|nr:sigma-54 dependent transcriptional regulator [Brumimicrobium oceani]PWH86811.1 regulator [Brumimicrobium oceani]
MNNQKKIKIYCVEDDLTFSKFLKYKLSLNPDFEVSIFNTANDLLESLRNAPDIITIDINLPDMQGDALIPLIKEKLPAAILLVISGQNNIQVAASMFKMGVYDYLVKDENTLERIWNVAHNAAKQIELKEEISVLEKVVNKKHDLKTFIKGESTEINNVFSKIEKAITSDINVIISGETGTGKDLVAKTIHFNSNKSKKAYVAVNVAAIPKELVESELFGHEKGAFTGAHQQRIGKFEEAKGGTLFLDEIGEMELPVQAKLLRVLQEMELNRVGGNKNIPLDFRLIIATHRDLKQEVKEGRFREDLYYRLMGFSIDLPPLRERGKDTLFLARFFIEQFSRKNKIKIKELNTCAKKLLLKYKFPGNVRELKAVIETAILMGEEDKIMATDLQVDMADNFEINYKSATTLEDYTIAIIQKKLEENNNNVVLTATKLAVGKSTIYRYIKQGKIKI